MDSYPQQQQSNQAQQMTSGLTRNRSAPSSFFTSILSNDDFGGDDLNHLINSKASGQDFFSRFTWDNTDSINFSNVEQSSSYNDLGVQVKIETEVQQRKDFTSLTHMYQNQSQNQQFSDNIKPPQFSEMNTSSSNLVASIKAGGNSNLIRHSSSPAGHFNQLDFDNEFGGIKGMGNLGMNSWDDSTLISEEFLKELRDDDPKLFSNINESNNQSNEGRNRPPKRLAHHLSLPANSTEFSSALENLSEDSSVLCKLRAKRGCATHPRSIAERVRRSKISERMRKLQELVPNMDKQTNTSDMLDFAVDYIKDLERQLKGLQEKQAKCTCNCN
ncbi:hypothetical protein Leryth_010922 [Lithospermum erythrorhizon]|nr:hypothetical protein Leryth_010922 [Lithospermum erythrorhizon]